VLSSQPIMNGFMCLEPGGPARPLEGPEMGQNDEKTSDFLMNCYKVRGGGLQG